MLHGDDGAAHLTPDPASRARLAARAADAKKATAVVVLDVGDIISITECFVLASGANPRQVRSIVEHVEAELKEHCEVAPLRVEGRDDYAWVLLDYGELVVHVFLEETRAYYDLDRLWADAPALEWELSEV